MNGTRNAISFRNRFISTVNKNELFIPVQTLSGIYCIFCRNRRHGSIIFEWKCCSIDFVTATKLPINVQIVTFECFGFDFIHILITTTICRGLQKFDKWFLLLLLFDFGLFDNRMNFRPNILEQPKPQSDM